MVERINIFVILGAFLTILTGLSCTKDPIEIPEPDTIPPQAMVLLPIDGESVAGEITVLARATDNDQVDSVRFFINQEWVGTDSSGSGNENNEYKFEWNTSETVMVDGALVKKYAEDEFHFISVVAFDPVDNSYASVPIRSKVDNDDNEAPTAFFLSPFAGQYVSGTVDITVIASDNDSIQYVSYFINNILQGYIQESPYVFPWNTHLVESGNYYSLHVNVRDMSNNITTVPPISVIVDNGIQDDITPPTGSIVSPPAGLTVSGEVQIIISASDNRAMDEVALSIDGIYITTIEQAPYYYSWDTTLEEEDTEHTISVVLVDLAGNETPLNPIAVTVDNEPPGDSTPPTIIIMEPAAGQNLMGTVSIEVLATDDTGIDFIEFYIDGFSDTTDSSDPYIYEWDTETVSDDMEHIIAVVGYDLEGNSTLATPIAVYIDNFDNIAPMGQIQNPVPGQTVAGTIAIEISASDNVGVRQLDLSIDGIPRDTLFDYPYQYNWDTTQETDDEDHVISVVVSDTSGNIAYVAPVSVYVDNEINDITPPIGTISNPLSGQTVSDTVAFTVIAQDDYGVAEVEFFIDGGTVAVDTLSPYQYDWDTITLENGSQHTLSATVTDDAAHTTIVQPVLVTVSN